MFSSILDKFSLKKTDKGEYTIGFEDVLDFIKQTHPQKKQLLINTLPTHEQSILIQGTLFASSEEQTINKFIEDYETDTVRIVVYGKNSADPTVWDKWRQLLKLGFRDVYVYSGGLFEWLLLQDIYGETTFTTLPLSVKCSDILMYRAPKKMQKN